MPKGGYRPGSGRPAGSVTKRTREIADRAIAEGCSPLEVMLANMRHFQKEAADAEAVLDRLTPAEFAKQVTAETTEEQFKILLAQVKKTAGFRNLAQESARDAAPYMHARLAAVEHTGRNGAAIDVNLTTDAERAKALAVFLAKTMPK